MLFLTGVVLFAINLEWALRGVYAGNTVCTSSHTDWYTSVIGETPCRTYERLRQICNPSYQVGTLTRNTPPDHCDDQVQECCCNSISFALSMLCLACQDNTADGFDAGKTAYQLYLMSGGGNTCNPRKDKSFTTTIQNAVCNTGLKIEDQLYNLFWSDGQWFYVYTRDSIIRDHAAFSNRTQTKCLPPAPPPPPPPPPSSSVLPSSEASKSPSGTTSSSGMEVLSTPSSSGSVSTGGSSVESSSTTISSSTPPSNSITSIPPSDTTSVSKTSAPSSSGSAGLVGTAQTAESSSNNSSQFGPGAIAGTVVGVVVVVALLIFIFFLVWRRRRGYATTASPGVDPYTVNSAGTTSSTHNLSKPTSPKYLSDSDETTSPPALTTRFSKRGRERQRQRRPHPSISNITTSSDGEEPSYTAPNSSISGALSRELLVPRHAESAERHVDAGPVPGANLGRSDSGRLPPAYGEQLSSSGYVNRAAEDSHLLSPELGARNEPNGIVMREAGSTQFSVMPLVPLRYKG